ncbi:MAG: hypothetical protein UY65_C0021G0010 [Parcubacteria group bacterium GW2011_GWA2_51_12]|nr:MAG: hypothetical protein UY65_C0021G0010 [Parcubacteria group bacterium GW2011_GWA2_51_12]
MSFITKKVQTETLGEYLRRSRTRLHYSLLEAAKFARIQPKFLTALEEGQYTALPAAVYVRGFLKSLADLYTISPHHLLEQYDHEQQIATNLKSRAETDPKEIVIPRFILSPRTLISLGLVLLGVMSLSYLYFQVSSLSRAPRLEVYSPEADGIVNEANILVRGKTEPDATVYLNNQAIVTDVNGEFRENLSLGPGPNQLVIKSVNKFGKETSMVRSLQLQEKEIAGVSVGVPEEDGELTLEVIVGPASSWIYLEADGVEQFSGTMLPQSERRVRAKNNIILTTGDAGSTHVYLNGQDLGVLGKEGEVIRDIEFTR